VLQPVRSRPHIQRHCSCRGAGCRLRAPPFLVCILVLCIIFEHASAARSLPSLTSCLPTEFSLFFLLSSKGLCYVPVILIRTVLEVIGSADPLLLYVVVCVALYMQPRT